jgi:hypothetical protein
MTRFWSCEETLVVIGAVIVAMIFYKLFKTSALVSFLIAILTAAAIAYATLSEFVLRDDLITYRSRFDEQSFSVTSVERVGMSTFLGGLPGHTFVFVMRRPAAIAGFSFRTGLVSWPSAGRWLEAVNLKIPSKSSEAR